MASVELKDGKEKAEISRKGCAIPFIEHCSNSGKALSQVMYDRGVLGHLEVNE